ncbi:hypothetical protein [Indioceanicola profundi]|uniref:hypothetical protein n=1 Tax=Indioceanicola profundi TaxID=2220096 RepID=UPI000E6AD918|nr:hypothetical protein [Indioceanicola profundi]
MVLRAFLPGRSVPVAAMAIGAALAVYGLASAPAPPSPGIAEALIGLFLIAGAGLARPLWLGSFYLLRSPDLRPSEAGACLALLLAVWPGLLSGLARGWPYAEMARDLLPLAFLFLPVLVRYRAGAETEAALDAIAWALAGVGLAYALRWWVDLNASLRTIGAAALIEKPPFLLKSAALPFASVWLFARGLEKVGSNVRIGGIVVGSALMVASFSCLGALAGAVHRAGLILSCGSILIILVRYFDGSAKGRLGATVVLSMLGLLWGEAVSVSADLAMEKTRAVGVNNRLGELMAVIRQAAADPLSFLFGYGWGGMVRSPAAGDIVISYTHNFATYMLLKTGAVGLLGMGAYVATILARLPHAWRARPDLVLALAPSLLIGLLLHTTYKYLCFGIVLTLLLLASEPALHRKG